MREHIMVTGGCGYIGQLLTESLLEEGHRVTVVDTMWFGNFLKEHNSLTIIKEDIRNFKNINISGIKTVFHLANIANDPCSDLNSKLNWEVNVLSTMEMIEHCISNNVSQFIYASSGSVYGVKDEEEVTEDLSLVPITDYNKTKMISERVLLSYSNDLLIQCIRPATVCGYAPRMRLDLSVNMLTMQALVNKNITVFGGNQTRPNIHIKDLIGVYMHLFHKKEECAGIYNAGFENMSIMDIAMLAADLSTATIEVTKSNDPRSYRLSSKKLLETGFLPQHSVKDAMIEVIDAYNSGILAMEDICYNIKTMKKLCDSGIIIV
ncbi:MAG: NAD-dependent epimerase/dehydratase [Rhodospirillaceae bacterium]|nr:NAD-dependent epimerase/dehydratase [Rhodospirillaceae bacterium]